MVKIGENSYKRLTIVAQVVAVTCFCAAFALSLYFADYRPSRPEPLAGRIYVHDMHGHITFITFAEHIALNGLLVCSAIIFVIGFLWERSLRRKSGLVA